MVKMKHASWFLSLTLISLPVPAGAEVVYQKKQTAKVMGKDMGAELTSSTNATQQAATSLKLQSMGTVLQALFALTTPPNTYDGVTYTEVYSFGKRVFTDSRYFSFEDGELHAGLAPTQVRVPVVAYPLGPVMLKLDAGVRFRADISARNMTNISFPIQYTEPGLQLTAAAAGAGFAEGYLSLFFVRGGVGGQLDLIDAKVDVNTRFSFETKQTLVTVSAIAEFLKGRIYAFLDLGFGFFGGWKRFIDKELYAWNGYCFATDNLTCPGK